jgi:hypothetical protein
VIRIGEKLDGSIETVYAKGEEIKNDVSRVIPYLKGLDDEVEELTYL